MAEHKHRTTFIPHLVFIIETEIHIISGLDSLENVCFGMFAPDTMTTESLNLVRCAAIKEIHYNTERVWEL